MNPDFWAGSNRVYLPVPNSLSLVSLELKGKKPTLAIK
jgi:hypothetical protein